MWRSEGIRLVWAAAWAVGVTAALEAALLVSSSSSGAGQEAAAAGAGGGGSGCFGPQLLPAFMLAPGFTNLNHGSFG